MNEKFNEIMENLNNQKFDEVPSLISSLTDEGLIIVATAAYNFYVGKQAEGLEVLSNIENIFDYFPKLSTLDELKETIYYYPLAELYKMYMYTNNPLVVDVSEYFYELDGDNRSLYGKYNFLLTTVFDESKNGSESLDLVEETIQIFGAEELLKFLTKNAFFNLVWVLIINDDSRGYDLALQIPKEWFTNEVNFYTMVINKADQFEKEDFIVKFVDVIGDTYYEDASAESMNTFEVYFKILLTRNDVDLSAALMYLSNTDSVIVKYASVYNEYIDKCNFSNEVKELVKVICENTIDEKNYVAIVNYIYYLFYNERYEEAFNIGIENSFNANDIIQWGIDLCPIDSKYLYGYYDYLIKLNNNDEPGYSNAVWGFRRLINYDLNVFKELFLKLDREKNTDLLDSYLFNILDEYNFYTADEVCNYLLELEPKGSKLYNVAVSYKMAISVEYDETENFIKLLDENEAVLEIIANLNAVRTPNYDIMKYLLTKSSKALYYVLKTSVKSYVIGNTHIKQDLEFARQILDKEYELFDEEEHKSISCYHTFYGLYEYFSGNTKSAFEYIEKSAYNSPDYCYCGGAYLLALERKVHGESVSEKHLEIVKKTLDGYKLVGRDEYVKEEFNPGPYFYYCYAYYALNGYEGFELDQALQYLRDECYGDIKTHYYQALVAYKQGYEHTYNDAMYLLNSYRNKAVYEYEYEYFEILNNIDAKVKYPTMF